REARDREPRDEQQRDDAAAGGCARHAANIADVVARIALAAVAIVIAAGFAVQLHAHRLLRNAVGELEHEVNAVKDPGANRRAVHDAQRVADLRPGTTGLFTAVALDTRAKRLVAAERTALRATRREPENFA